ncbi:hypothetical protein [Mycobacterium avium]|uniref:hypothetical protein n=1 Tax=Mycobacterium avium TaxID=1764 RepID=UPI000BB0AF8C|nr:hypothetical protein [Mycobacterium avium]MDO2394508.1 hypothetical protein [Mycobacterium avium subsp. hominissuis]PBA13491.1 hypothetical protein CKJ69_17870 [Mycobacterium avium]PBA89533.1 hypothetical protein CKJ60_17870 [Mycobacterium avium]
MPRIRTIKPEFFRSPSTAKVDPLVRLFYQALWCWADDFGIGETNIYGWLGFAFPDGQEIYDPELRGFRALSAQDLRRFCADVARHFEITFYIVRGRHYYAIGNWDQHQKTERREGRRKNPRPDDPEAIPDLQFQDCAESAPICAGKPAQNPRKTGAGTGEQGNRGTEEPPYPPNEQPALPARRKPRDGSGEALARVRELNANARSTTAYGIAEAFSASLPVPIERGHLVEIGKQIDKCLRSNIPPPAIAAGLKAWSSSDSWSPTQIPNFVHKANNGALADKATAKAVGYADAADELLAEVTTL